MINFANGSEPIIDPWLLYLADVLDGLKFFIQVLAFIAIAYSVICFVALGFKWEDHDKDRIDTWCKKLKKSILPVIVSITFAIVVPSKDTLYKMAIAQALTPDNVKMAYDVTGKTANDILNGGSEFIKDIMDYGVEKIDEIRTGSSEEEE